MLDILGPKRSDRQGGWTRRTLLTVGSLGCLGGSLVDLLQAEAAAGSGGSRRSVINIHLDGGPPQLDLFDLKPEAPVEIRGEFRGIDSALPGLPVCELMPRLAQLAERFVFIRSLIGSAGAHDGFQCQSGFPASDLLSLGGRPAMGCVVNKLRGQPTDQSPPFVDLMLGRPMVRNSARPGFLGPSYKAFRPDLSRLFVRTLEQGMQGELARRGADHTTSLSLHAELTIDRLEDRTQLLSGLDRLRRSADASGMMDAMDRFSQQALGILTSGTFARAMDLSQEPAEMLSRYTPESTPGVDLVGTSEDASSVKKLLLARRLVEAGVRCVSVSFSDFDTHRDNFGRLRRLLPLVDHALWALVTDLEERGMLHEVSIVVWGEFGRTPKINSNGGRDHWPGVGPALLAGGGMRTGQVIGETDRTGSAVKSRPVHYQDVLATLYHNLGIASNKTTLIDPSGRPQYLLDRGQVIREIV